MHALLWAWNNQCCTIPLISPFPPSCHHNTEKSVRKNVSTSAIPHNMVYNWPIYAISSFLMLIHSIICLLRSIYTLSGLISFISASPGHLFAVSACHRLFPMINTLSKVLPLIHAGSGFFSKICAVSWFVPLIRIGPLSMTLTWWLLNGCNKFLEVPYILREKLQVTVVSSFNPKGLIFFFTMFPKLPTMWTINYVISSSLKDSCQCKPTW